MIEDDPNEIVGAEVTDRDGRTVGTTAEILTTLPDGSMLIRVESEFLGQPTRTLIAPKSSFDGSVVRLPCNRATIDAGPVLGNQFSTAELDELVRYYSDDGPPRPVVSPDEAHAVSVLRSEERIDARTRVRAHTLVRIRKVVVFEEQTVTVPVRRETLVVERVELDPETGTRGDGSTSGWAPALTDETNSEDGIRKDGQLLFQTTLHEERVVVTTEIVALERARLRVEVDNHEERVSAPLRREHVDVVKDT